MKRLVATGVIIALGLLGAACGSSLGESRHGEIPHEGGIITYVVNVPEGEGPFPTMVYGPGSGDMPASHSFIEGHAEILVGMGFAVVRYDKQGTGGSTGEIVGLSLANSPDTVPQMAREMLAVIDEVIDSPQIDKDRFGVFGLSQASWYMPIVVEERDEIDFAIYLSAGTIPLGVHLLFEELSIHDQLPLDEATTMFEEELLTFNGPLGFDQRPILESEDRPMLFLLGESDPNVPFRVNRDGVTRLAEMGIPAAQVSYPDGVHGLPDIDFWPDVELWLTANGFMP